MDIYNLIAAFGGGLFGACIGALPAFILTGVIAIAGGIAALSGAADLSIGYIAFGSFLGPHIAFAGGVAAAGFAANKRENDLKSGADILTSLNGFGDYLVLIVGGIFGILGYLIKYLYADILNFQTDTVAFTVFTLGVIARFMFGSTGLFGKTDEKRSYFDGLLYNTILGGGIGIVVGYIAGSINNLGIDESLITSFPIICFGISATSLIFTQTGFATPATHHITWPAAYAAVVSGNPLMGVVFGIVGSLIGVLAGKTINSYCDTHIDPPATAIFITMFIINAIF